LTVTISGLPAGFSAAVTVTGPGGFSRSLTATTTLTGLTPGAYTVQANQVGGEGQVYAATPPTQTANVAIGQTASATVTYALVLGNLTINVAGLPAGVAAAIVVTGPGGFTRNVTATTTIQSLTPGTYTVTASNVTSGGQAYAPNVATQTAAVGSGQTVVRNVTYAAAGTPPDANQSTLDACPAAVPVSTSSTIRVSARTASGSGIPGAQVLLSVSGTGNQFSSSLTTDASGNASTPFSSSVAQVKSVTAQITSAGTTINKTFGLGVFGPQPATQLVKISGDNQTIPVGTPGLGFVVEARNASGAPVANIPVAWAFGNCFFNTTGTNGRTSAVLSSPFRTTPGGPFTITASIPGGPSVSFTFTYVAGALGSVTGRVSGTSVPEPAIPAGKP
jgi:hypothetical protein